MPRVTPLTEADLPEPVKPVFRALNGGYGHFGNQAAMLAHVPPALFHLGTMLTELKQRGAVKWRYIELAIVVVSRLNACDYCVAHHAPVLEVEGVSAEAIATLPATDHPEFDEADRAVIDYARQVTETPGRIREAMFTRLRAHFTEGQIVELTLRIGLCGFFNRFNDALQIELEPALG